MSLILAIEPNKNQAHQLGALVRAHLKAELVTAPTAAAALAALGDRIPDVVLTPALFGLRDETALTERLRQLGSDGSHVQTLAIPILAPASSRGSQNSLLGGKRAKADANVGCDPAVFAEQIRIYLQRASVERRAQASEAAARAMVSRPTVDADTSASDDLSAFMVSADELDVDSLVLSSIDPPVAPAPAKAAAAESDDEEQSRRSKARQSSRPPSAVEEELGLVTPPAAGPPLWRVTESIEDFYGNGEGPDDSSATYASAAPVNAPPPPTAAAPAADARRASQSTAASAPRVRRSPPQPNEWAYVDPSQAAIKALIRRLDEIAGAA